MTKDFLPVSRPFLDRDELTAIGGVFEKRWLGQGEEVAAFEEALGRYLGAKHVIAINTGTTALQLAMHALELGPGDEVIVPSMTFCASIQAITATGATPIFCEVTDTDLNMDVEDVRTLITERTRAIMPVHYCGNACDMDAILQLAEDKGLTVIEDAAHAFGSKYKGRMIGSFGHFTCFSFDPIKNITSGEGGAIVTASDEMADRLRKMRMLGIDRNRPSGSGGEYDVVVQGYRFHMSNMNAAVGLTQLARAHDFQARKSEIVNRYNAEFAGLEHITLLDWNMPDTFAFSYVLRVTAAHRDAFRAHLKDWGVGTGMHYPPNHLLSYYSRDNVRLPRTEKIAQEIVTIPLYYEMTDADVDRVIEAVSSFAVESEYRLASGQ